MSTHLTRICAVTGVAAVLFGTASTPAFAAPSDGYVRLAHLSPDTPAVDVYLYSFGKKSPRLVLKHVGYGALSPYQRLSNGGYTVAMRPANAAASSPPVLSANVRVRAGAAYTVAGMGPYKGVKLRVLDDSAKVTADHAGLRLIGASLKQQAIDVSADGQTIASDLRLATVTEYQSLPAKTVKLEAKGATGKAVTTSVKLTAGSTHTVVALDGKSGLQLLDLRDSAGAREARGGVDTGLGGLAPRSGDGLPWQFPAAVVLTAASIVGLRLTHKRSLR